VSRITPISYKKFEKFLFKVGCEFVRQKGDHRIYKKEGLARPIIIPAVKEIPVFIILNNLRILGISREEYLEIIKKV
jgi:predicted RNA binding protein YcfA (HicA-like mRNA interferase family)